MKLVIFGASGHGKVVASIAKDLELEIIGFLDDNPERHGEEFFSCRVMGEVSNAITSFNAVIGIGSNQVRKRLAENLSNITWLSLKSRYAVIDPSISLGAGSVVMAGAVIQADAKIGTHCIVNTNASIDHDCIIGNYVHVAPGATLCGNVQVGECTHVGAGSVIKQGIKIGKNATIGAGSIVVKNVLDGALVYGNPAIQINKESLCE